jgi:quercetin dioxygenase-like cupin family protein
MKIAKADEIAARPVGAEGAEGVQIRLLIHEADGAPTFYMRQFTVAPGGHTPRHEHDWEHEVYVLAGRGAVWTEDGEQPVAAGDCVFVPPDETHQFRNTGPDDLKFLCLVPRRGDCGGPPGRR